MRRAPRQALPRRPRQAAGAEDGAPLSIGDWQVRETPNFRIYHLDAALAERVAEAAEAARTAQSNRWAGAVPRGAWSPKCDIYLYPSAKTFSKMTGQPEESPGFSTMGLNAGKIVARRINLRADHPNLQAAILPHEITHVILADLFPTQQIPRWADEGMAVLAEPSSEQQARASDLGEPLAANRLFKLNDLMVMDYPDGKHWALYYAQSVSLTRFLVDLEGPARFIEFVQGSQRNGPEAELRRVYKIEGFADLQARWLAYAKAESATMTASAPDTGRRGPDRTLSIDATVSAIARAPTGERWPPRSRRGRTAPRHEGSRPDPVGPTRLAGPDRGPSRGPRGPRAAAAGVRSLHRPRDR